MCFRRLQERFPASSPSELEESVEECGDDEEDVVGVSSTRFFLRRFDDLSEWLAIRIGLEIHPIIEGEEEDAWKGMLGFYCSFIPYIWYPYIGLD